MDYLIWIIVAVVLAVAEILTAGFIMIFFAMGALVTAVVAYFIPELVWQLVTFLVSSVIFVAFARPLLKNTFNIGDKPGKPSNVVKLVNEEVLVLEPVTRYGGKVKVLHSGEIWTAYLDEATGEDTTLPEGQEGIVVSVDGAKLVVRSKASANISMTSSS